MKISCVIVSYNNGKLLEEAIMSVVSQTRPVDEIIVADDASTDGSRQLIQAVSRSYPKIKPILRERNVGVSTNRDLAIREARGDFITTLDGDDYFLPNKIEAEAKALSRSSAVIAYSDVRVIHYRKRRFRVEEMADFSRLEASERVRWILSKRTPHPREMLLAKDVHLEIGGYNHSLRTYEDWDYKLRMAAQPHRWAHSGTEGVVHRLHPGGLSRMTPAEHTRDRYRVLRLNRKLACRHVGLPFFVATVASMVLGGAKWWVVYRYWDNKERMLRMIRPSGPSTS